MPELPEVETIRRGFAPLVEGESWRGAVLRQRKLRRLVPTRLSARIAGHTILSLERRGKYLIFRSREGALLLHLGMSGCLLWSRTTDPAGPHDHVDLLLSRGRCLRFRDPRRFGLLSWVPGDPLARPPLAELGPEPLGTAFTAADLYRRSRGRRVALKSFLLDGREVAGVGNIYATEALFRARLRPGRAAGRITRGAAVRLHGSLRAVLREAIAAGGTTLQDFRTADGSLGRFQRELAVYGREGEPCPRCGQAIRRIVLGGRGSWYCPRCQD